MQGWLSGAVAMFVVCAVGCTALDVKTDFDPTIDFSRFKTFAFTGLTDLDQGGILDNSLIRQRLENMIGKELQRKGLTQVGLEQNPDLLVHYWVGVKDKQQVHSTGTTYGGYGFGSGYGWGAGYGGVSTYDYREGTLIVDLVEPTNKTLVWRATMVAELENSMKENAELSEKVLKKAFEDYPPSKAKE
ncbi:DUF4136 domain-containing protein [Nitrospira sp. BLG_2]|uniref:DUF4136 domain-containing protein n=1 Tax=Nitrospira sp. BLG_2 TaxID=3397507 RepID=UPI003B9C6391